MKTSCLALAIVMLLGCREEAEAPMVYISNETEGTVVVIDPARREVVASIPVGKRPRGLRVSPDGDTLYVALSGSPRGGPHVDESTLPPPDRSADGIGVVDLRRRELVRVLESGPDPESFDLLPGGRLAVSNEDAALTSIVDIASGKVLARVPVGVEPEGVTVAAGLAFVTSETDNRIDVVDPDGADVIATIPVGARPRMIAFTRDGKTGLVTNETDGSITIFDAKARKVRRTVEVGGRPMGIALTADDRHALVTTGRGRGLAVVEVGSGEVVRSIADVGQRPWGIAVDRAGLAYTANGPGGDVSVVDPRSGEIVARIETGGSPWGVAMGR